MRKKITAGLIFSALVIFGGLSAGCAATYQGYQGGVAGAGVGAVAGALIDSDNPWRGGAIGAGLGALFGSALGDASAGYDGGGGYAQPYYAPAPSYGYYGGHGRGHYRQPPRYDHRPPRHGGYHGPRHGPGPRRW